MFQKMFGKPETPDAPKNPQQQRYLDTVGAKEVLEQRYSDKIIEVRAFEDGVELWQEYLLSAHRLESTLELDDEHRNKFGGRDEKVISALRQRAEKEALSKGVSQETMNEYKQSLEAPTKE